MLALPTWPAAGVTVTVRFLSAPPKTMFAFGTRVWSEEDAKTVSVEAADSLSSMVKPSGAATLSWAMNWPAMAVIVGGVFGGGRELTGVTVTVNARASEPFWGWPSLTVTVMVAD